MTADLGVFDRVIRDAYAPVIRQMLEATPWWTTAITDEDRERWRLKREALDEALWNVGVTREDADRIGNDYYYGRYGDNDY